MPSKARRSMAPRTHKDRLPAGSNADILANSYANNYWWFSEILRVKSGEIEKGGIGNNKTMRTLFLIITCRFQKKWLISKKSL